VTDGLLDGKNISIEVLSAWKVLTWGHPLFFPGNTNVFPAFQISNKMKCIIISII
jgi:hypothetical protein